MASEDRDELGAAGSERRKKGEGERGAARWGHPVRERETGR
jgi:hypothetical protein